MVCMYVLSIFCIPAMHSQFLMMGRSDRGSYFIPQKITTSEFVYRKNHYFFSIHKKSLSPFFHNLKKSLCFSFVTPKYPSIFHSPKKITLGQNLRPKKITRTLLSLKYVSGAPGAQHSNFCIPDYSLRKIHNFVLMNTLCTRLYVLNHLLLLLLLTS